MILFPNYDSVYYFNRMREAVPVTEVGSQCRLTFKMPGIKSTDLKASVTSPTGKVKLYMKYLYCYKLHYVLTYGL